MKETLRRFIAESTIHGLPKVLASERMIFKVIWIVCFIASSSVCIWFIFASVFSYLNFSVVTQLETIYEQPTQFVTVQFCSQDRVTFDRKNLTKGQLLKQCVFNYDSDCLENPGSYFEAYTDPTYNTCFRFNSGKGLNRSKVPILNSTIGGKDDSFIMEINAPRGIVVWIHNYTSPPKRQFKNNHNGDIGFAPTGFETHFIVEKTVDTKLGEPYNNCLKDVSTFTGNKTIIDHILKKGEVYTQVNCLELCFDLDTIENNRCNCTNPVLGQVWTNCYGLINNLVNTSTCTLDYKMGWYKQNLAEKYSNYCPLECDSMSYLVINRMLTNVVNSNNSYIWVYYKTLKYTLISQQPRMLIADLIPYIGGIFGLFLGSSFLSFVEIVEFLIELILTIIDTSSKVESFN